MKIQTCECKMNSLLLLAILFGCTSSYVCAGNNHSKNSTTAQHDTNSTRCLATFNCSTSCPSGTWGTMPQNAVCTCDPVKCMCKANCTHSSAVTCKKANCSCSPANCTHCPPGMTSKEGARREDECYYLPYLGRAKCPEGHFGSNCTKCPTGSDLNQCTVSRKQSTDELVYICLVAALSFFVLGGSIVLAFVCYRYANCCDSCHNVNTSTSSFCGKSGGLSMDVELQSVFIEEDESADPTYDEWNNIPSVQVEKDNANNLYVDHQVKGRVTRNLDVGSPTTAGDEGSSSYAGSGTVTPEPEYMELTGIAEKKVKQSSGKNIEDGQYVLPEVRRSRKGKKKDYEPSVNRYSIDSLDYENISDLKA